MQLLSFFISCFISSVWFQLFTNPLTALLLPVYWHETTSSQTNSSFVRIFTPSMTIEGATLHRNINRMKNKHSNHNMMWVPFYFLKKLSYLVRLQSCILKFSLEFLETLVESCKLFWELVEGHLIRLNFRFQIRNVLNDLVLTFTQASQ